MRTLYKGKKLKTMVALSLVLCMSILFCGNVLADNSNQANFETFTIPGGYLTEYTASWSTYSGSIDYRCVPTAYGIMLEYYQRVFNYGGEYKYLSGTSQDAVCGAITGSNGGAIYVNNITKVVIVFGEGPWTQKRDLTADELGQFKDLLKPIKCTLAGDRRAVTGAVASIVIYYNDSNTVNIAPSLIQASIWKSADGALTITKGGDELMNIICTLDIFSESGLMPECVNNYIDHQEKNGIPTTLERILEE